LLLALLSEALMPNKVIEYVGDFFKRLNHVVFFVVISVIVVFAAALINRFVLLQFMNSGDEHSCYFLAKCFLDGGIWATPHPLSEFFDVTHIGVRDGKWFSVYPPGWPLILAIGIAVGGSGWMNPIMSGLSTYLFALSGKKLFGPGISTFALVMMTTSALKAWVTISFSRVSSSLTVHTDSTRPPASST